jgi:hypothetical protein
MLGMHPEVKNIYFNYLSLSEHMIEHGIWISRHYDYMNKMTQEVLIKVITDERERKSNIPKNDVG